MTTTKAITATTVWTYLKKLAFCYWIGEMLFFAFVFAPRVFKVLARPDAGRLQNALFPPYFAGGLICAAVLIGALYFLQKNLEPRRLKLVLGLLALCSAIFAYLHVFLGPQIRHLQPFVLGGLRLEEFAALHKLSVGLNGIVLMVLLVLLALF